MVYKACFSWMPITQQSKFVFFFPSQSQMECNGMAQARMTLSQGVDIGLRKCLLLQSSWTERVFPEVWRCTWNSSCSKSSMAEGKGVSCLLAFLPPHLYTFFSPVEMLFSFLFLLYPQFSSTLFQGLSQVTPLSRVFYWLAQPEVFTGWLNLLLFSPSSFSFLFLFLFFSSHSLNFV